MNKKSVINVIVSASLAATLGAGALALTGCAGNDEAQTTEAVEVVESGYKVRIDAEGWDASTSTPAVLSFQKVDGSQFVYGDMVFEDMEALKAWASSEEGKDATGDVFEVDRTVGDPIYFSVACNEDVELDLDEGTYALSVVTPINADGSLYAAPETTHIEVPDEDAEPLHMTLVKAEDVTVEQMTSAIEALALVNGVDDAVVTADVLDRARANAETNPNVTSEQVRAAETTASEIVSSGNVGAAVNQAAQNTPFTSAQSNTGSSQQAPVQTAPSAPAPAPVQSTQPSAPAHTHSFSIPVTEQVWVDEGTKVVCSCGQTFSSTAAWHSHNEPIVVESAGEDGHSYSVQPTGHYETKTVGYKCSCGAQQ